MFLPHRSRCAQHWPDKSQLLGPGIQFRDKRKKLDCLIEAHVMGDNSMEAMVEDVATPSKSFPLTGASDF
jgi:hypothetical protein